MFSGTQAYVIRDRLYYAVLHTVAQYIGLWFGEFAFIQIQGQVVASSDIEDMF